MRNIHTFHIPVMGIGYTVDTPLKVAKYGIDSVISLVDDILLEKLREMYCRKTGRPYQEITNKTDDFRAKRITAYLDLIDDLAEKEFNEFKEVLAREKDEAKAFIDLLPDTSTFKHKFTDILNNNPDSNELKEWLDHNFSKGSIDVNIMTKIDKDNYHENKQLPIKYNDAHAALRGFANSKLSSALVLSAGMNPRLYSYMETFDDFYPDKNGYFKKRIILKVSDYRSAFIQGKFLAKKGLWVSEFRIESGLNCGGHAFASDGYLMGPILEEFKKNREKIQEKLYSIFQKALADKGKTVPSTPMPIKITAQGGVGTAEEHNFLLEYYNLNSVGWGTPFLLAPDVVNIDDHTLQLLKDATEEDLYVSDISPLGVLFNSLKNNTKDIEKQQLIDKGTPGSNCPKDHLASNKEFTDRAICTASRRYQRLKIAELDKMNLPEDEYRRKYNKIVEKSCICVGLGTSALLVNNIDTKIEGSGVSICPGPNLAYFSRQTNLKEMINHIYGRINIMTRTDRPHMFITEIKLYVSYLQKKIEETNSHITEKQAVYFDKFIHNMQDGIQYYRQLFSNTANKLADTKHDTLEWLNQYLSVIENAKSTIDKTLLQQGA